MKLKLACAHWHHLAWIPELPSGLARDGCSSRPSSEPGKGCPSDQVEDALSIAIEMHLPVKLAGGFNG